MMNLIVKQHLSVCTYTTTAHTMLAVMMKINWDKLYSQQAQYCSWLWAGSCSCHRCYRCSGLGVRSMCESGSRIQTWIQKQVPSHCLASVQAAVLLLSRRDSAPAFSQNSSPLPKFEIQFQSDSTIVSPTRQDSSGTESSQMSLWAVVPTKRLSTVTVSKQSDIGSFASYRAKLF